MSHLVLKPLEAQVANDDLSKTPETNKMAKLEAELRRLIVAVDDRLSMDSADHLRSSLQNQEANWVFPTTGWNPKQLAALAGVAVLLVATGWAGSSAMYSAKLKSQVEDELRPYARELAETVTTIQADLGPRLATAEQLQSDIDSARQELIARDEEFETTITTAQNQLLGIRDTAIDDIERRLTDQSDDLTTTLETFRKRAVELDKGLNEVSQALAAFDHQLPILTENFGKIATKLTESQTIMAKVSEETLALEGLAPPLLATITEHQEGLEAGTKTLVILQTQLEALKGQTMRSSQQLEKVLEQGRLQITDWDNMDRQVDHRKQEIMRTLDVYANSLNSRIREFLDVLNGETVFTGG